MNFLRYCLVAGSFLYDVDVRYFQIDLSMILDFRLQRNTLLHANFGSQKFGMPFNDFWFWFYGFASRGR
jgi:hypothetical protein